MPFQADARAINDKVRLYARVGGAVIAARKGKQDAFGSVKNLGRYAASWIAWWPNRPSSTAALT